MKISEVVADDSDDDSNIDIGDSIANTDWTFG